MTTMIWKKMARSKRYREHFVSANAKRAFAFQLRAIMKKRDLSQEKLAELCGLTQGVISRAADPSYGKLTVTIKTKIANGLDMAYLGTLVPFSDAERWFTNLSEESVQIPTFVEEESSLVDALEGTNKKEEQMESVIVMGPAHRAAIEKGQTSERNAVNSATVANPQSDSKIAAKKAKGKESWNFQRSYLQEQLA